MASKPLTLAQLAKAAGMSTADVEFYQQRGLLQPARRTRGQPSYPAFHQEHLDRLRLIGRAVVYGFTLDAIARIVDASSLLTCRDMMDIAETELQRLRVLMGPDAPPVAALRKLMEGCPGTGTRDDCNIYAALTRDAGQTPDC